MPTISTRLGGAADYAVCAYGEVRDVYTTVRLCAKDDTVLAETSPRRPLVILQAIMKLELSDDDKAHLVGIIKHARRNAAIGAK